MERMVERGHPVPLLKDQCRSVARLMKLVSNIFYHRRLTDGPGTALIQRAPTRAQTGVPVRLVKAGLV